MSSISEIAKREGDEAEAESPDVPEPDAEPTPEPTPDAEPEADPDAEPEPEPEPVTEATLAKVGKKIEAEDKRHEKALRAAYGEFWGERQPCPLCLQEGFVEIAQPGEFDPTQRAAVVAAMGEAAAPSYRDAKDAHRCPTCDGWGQCLSGAQREPTQLVDCVDCGGLGYVRQAPGTNVVPLTPPSPTSTYPPPPAPMGADAANQDAWGRPMGHPHWGISPALAGL